MSKKYIGYLTCTTIFTFALISSFILASCNEIKILKATKPTSTEIAPNNMLMITETPLPTNLTTISAPRRATATITITLPPYITPIHPRIPLYAGECGAMNENGHILFLQRIKGENAGNYDLWVMNGNGCYRKRVMEHVSGAPDWSRDWKQIVIGCDANQALCILNAETTLASCDRSAESECEPDIVMKVPLPEELSGKSYISNLAWSPEGDRIAVEGETVQSEIVLNLVTMTAEGSQWERILTQNITYDMTWPPSGDRLAVSSGYIDLETHELSRAPFGLSPQWSPDGEKMVFLKAAENSRKTDPFGIGWMKDGEEIWEWLYEPGYRDATGFPKVLIHTNERTPIFAWSPNEKYIAFVCQRSQSEADIRIVRMNLGTKEMAAFDLGFAPAWGP